MIFAPPLPEGERRPRKTSSEAVLEAKKSYVSLAEAGVGDEAAAEATSASSARSANGPKPYPPSRTVHRGVGHSYLSSEAPTQNYRGLFNLSLIVLVVSHIRQILNNLLEHGLFLRHIFVGKYVGVSYSEAPLANFPAQSGFALLPLFVLASFFVEDGLARGKGQWCRFLPDDVAAREVAGGCMHAAVCVMALLVPTWIVWNFRPGVVGGVALMMTAMILFMKLVSYAHANADYRRAVMERRERQGDKSDKGAAFLYPK